MDDREQYLLETIAKLREENHELRKEVEHYRKINGEDEQLPYNFE